MLKQKNGFTIVELLIVIVIIGILAAITTVAYNGMQVRARDTVRTNDIRGVQKALELYVADNGKYPLDDYSVHDFSQLSALLVPKYVSKLPADPRGSASAYDYRYVSGAGTTGYGILVNYEGKPACRYEKYNPSYNWWDVQPC